MEKVLTTSVTANVFQTSLSVSGDIDNLSVQFVVPDPSSDKPNWKITSTVEADELLAEGYIVLSGEHSKFAEDSIHLANESLLNTK